MGNLMFVKFPSGPMDLCRDARAFLPSLSYAPPTVRFPFWSMERKLGPLQTTPSSHAGQF
eukprot:768425-Hanusia_phi.AAC.2